MNQPSTTGDPPYYSGGHHCVSYPCPICHPNLLGGWCAPQPQIIFQPTGCICPPTSEQTCQNQLCPRKARQL